MDPNSRHQLWSKWTILVRPAGRFAPTFDTVQANTARFMRKAFGQAAQCRIRRFRTVWVVEVLADAQRHPDDKPTFVALSRDFTTFFRNGFGHSADVRVKARLMAGERVDGKPPDQLLMMPTISDVFRAAGVRTPHWAM